MNCKNLLTLFPKDDNRQVIHTLCDIIKCKVKPLYSFIYSMKFHRDRVIFLQMQ